MNDWSKNFFASLFGGILSFWISNYFGNYQTAGFIFLTGLFMTSWVHGFTVGERIQNFSRANKYFFVIGTILMLLGFLGFVYH